MARIFSKLPYLKKDILWAILITGILFLTGSPVLTLPWVNNVIFVIFAFIVWRKKTALDNKNNFILSAGRVFSLNALIVILFFLIAPLFSNLQILAELLFDSVRLSLFLGVIIYALQYYIFTLWGKRYDFKAQKKLIFIELAGLILIQFIG